MGVRIYQPRHEQPTKLSTFTASLAQIGLDADSGDPAIVANVDRSSGHQFRTDQHIVAYQSHNRSIYMCLALRHCATAWLVLHHSRRT